MKKIAGLFVGSGASRKISLGFIPDRVVIQNITAADVGEIRWSRLMAGDTRCPEGIKVLESTGLAATVLAAGAGIRPYIGGEDVTAAGAAILMPVHMIPDLQGDLRNAGTLGPVDTWTLGHAGNRTGNFNAGVNTSKVGKGSRLLIGEEWYTIQAMTNDGDAANEVTLDRAALSGEIKKILYPYDYHHAPAGSRTMPGIILAETADVNVATELCYIEAESYSD